jgi:RHS repeat-associated protein
MTLYIANKGRKMMIRKYTGSTIIAFFVIVLAILLLPNYGAAYNKSWDQGHKCVNPTGAEDGWGRYGYDTTSESDIKDGYTSKECCELLCKICPVYAHTGRLQKTFTDLTIPGVGPSLNITRTYLSQERSTSLLGHGWLFNFGKRLIISRNKAGDKIVVVRQETGEINFFKEHPDSSLERLTSWGLTYDLVKNTDNTYTIVSRDGSWHEIQEDGRIAKIVDRNQNELVFTYNSVGCLSRITNASGNYVDIQLGANGKIASASDNLGRTVAYGYDENGNLVSVTDPIGNTTQYVYNSNNLLAQFIDARGNVVESATYDNNQPPRVSTFTEKGETYTIAYFDGRTEKTDSQGNKWTYYFSELGIIERVIDPLGNETKQQPNKVTSTSVEWEEDANGNRTTYTYDSDENIASKTDPLGNVWTYTYIAGTDLLETETNPLGVVTKYEYDGNGNQTAIIRDFGGPLENRSSYTYDSQGNQTSITDPLGNTTTYENDANGNLIRVTDQLGNVTTYTYDSRGNKLTKTDPKGNTTSYAYLGDRLTSIIDPLGNTTNFAYDANGNIVEVQYPDGNKTTFSYDEYNRVTHKTDALGNTTATKRDINNNILELTDSNGKTIRYTYDTLGRKIQSTDPLGNTTNFAYDANGNTTSIIDAKGNNTRYEYDKNSRVIREIRPMGQESSYTYDEVGKLVSMVDEKSQKTEYVYDDVYRIKRVKYYTAQDYSNPVRTVSFNYDKVGNLVNYDDATTTTQYSYDNAYRKISEKVNYGSFELSYTYTYNENGTKKSYTSPGGITYEYTYDANNRLIGVHIPGMGNITYSSNNRNLPTSVTFPGGTEKKYEYDSLTRIKSIDVRDAGHNVIMSYNYIYNKTGDVISKLTERGNYLYAYDELYRLTSVNNPVQDDEFFSYDAVDNRLTAASVGNWSYNLNNELLGHDGASYEYDQKGNMTRKIVDGQVTNYTYSAEGRLLRVEDGSGLVIAEYYYGPFGRRLWKEVEGERIYFFYTDEGLVGEYNSNGEEIRTYAYKPNSAWANDPLYIKKGSEYYFYMNDHLGTPIKVINVNGSVVWEAEYHSFGKAVVEGSSTIRNHLRFPGQYFDEETGLHYNRYRYYDPETGRFLTADPIGLKSGLNLYSYAFNNPVNWVDPSGLRVIDVTDSRGNKVGTIDTSMVNCIGYATQSGGALDPILEPEGQRTSLKQLFSALGYNCTANIFAKNCQVHCNCEEYVMLYVYIIKTYDFDAVRDKYKSKDPFADPIITSDNELDYHGLRGEDKHGYTYQPNRDRNLDIHNLLPTDNKPDYFGDEQTLGKYCCCN